MSKMPTISEIKSKILVSGNEAFPKYRKMTGGWGLAKAPESFIQNEIASALSKKNFCPYVSLEETIRTVIEEGRNADIDLPKVPGGRFDIVLWSDYGKPIAIEVKKCHSADSCTNDAERLREYVDLDVLKHGLLVAYMQVAKDKTLEKRVKDVAREIKTVVGNKPRAFRNGPNRVKDENEREWWWDIVCYQISKSC